MNIQSTYPPFLAILVSAIFISAPGANATNDDAAYAQLEARQSRLARICEKMQPLMSRPGNLKGIGVEENDEEIGAWTKGGNVIFTSGMMDFLEDDNEVAFVCGHELAHLNARDVKRERTTRLASYLMLAAGGALYETSDSTTGKAGGLAAAVLGTFLFSKKSRTHEREADRVGLLYAWDAGFDPRAATDLWRRFDEYESCSEAGKTGVRFAEDHPLDSERVENFKVLQASACFEAPDRPFCDLILYDKRYLAAYASYDGGRNPSGNNFYLLPDMGGKFAGQSPQPERSLRCGMSTTAETGFSLGACLVQTTSL